jgi:hypothetical protein
MPSAAPPNAKPGKASSAIVIRSFFVSGNSLVVGVGRSDQVQCDGEKTEGLSFRDGPQDQTRNLEIPGSHFVRPGMTTQLGR